MLAAGLLLFARIGVSGSAPGLRDAAGLLNRPGHRLSVVTRPDHLRHSGGWTAQSGLASGLVNTSRQAGGGLGWHLLISLATSTRAKPSALTAAVPVALTDGFRLAYVIGAGSSSPPLPSPFVFGRNSSPVPAAPRSRMAAASSAHRRFVRGGRTLGRPAPGARP